MIAAILFLQSAGVRAPKLTFPLTIESIMRGDALIGHAPRDLRWAPDGKSLRFSWAKADGTNDPAYTEYEVQADGTGLVKAKGEAPVVVDSVPKGSRFGDRIVYEQLGDLFIYNVADKSSKKIALVGSGGYDPRFTRDGLSVVYRSGDSLYKLDLSTVKPIQLTQTARGSINAVVPSTPVIGPMVVNIPSGWRSGTITPSTEGSHATLALNQPAIGGRRAEVPSYVTGSGYPEMIPTFVRVGGPQSHSKELFLNLDGRRSVEMATMRPGRVNAVKWSPDGSHAIALAEAEDHKDEWILGFDASTDTVSTLWDEHNDAWVGGPGRGELGWLPDGSKFYFESEKSGFANLYEMSAGGGDPISIVSGPYEVSDVRLDADRHRFTFISSEKGPAFRQLDAVDIDGGRTRKLADLSAGDDTTYAIAPDGEHVAVVRSWQNRPAELIVNGVQITTTPTAEWLAGPWTVPPFVTIPSTDGFLVAARMYKPIHWRRGGPAVMFVHGAGYLQNVFDGWSYYFREYMFQHFLMDHGYLVLDIDYRGSAGYGRDWRTAIYRHMGGKDLEDEIAGAKWLVDVQGAAKDRLGIYGGSYGGFLTLMAMFTKPGVFAAGAALRPVTDWSSYNHGYTSEILNLPQSDKEAYRQSSPINFAAGLEGALLICHGMVDTNVPFQDSVRLAEKLIELGKTNWSIAPFPIDDHEFTHPASWIDEYRRIFDLFERTIGSKRKR